MSKKAVMVIDYDKKKKKIGSWLYEDMAHYLKARKDGFYNTITAVKVLDVTVEGDTVISISEVEEE